MSASRLPNFNPAATALAIDNLKTEQKLKEVGMKIMEAKAMWLDRTMKEVLPDQIYKWGHGDAMQQKRAQQWLSDNGYYYEENPSAIRLMQKQDGKEAKRISEFRFQFDTKTPIQS